MSSGGKAVGGSKLSTSMFGPPRDAETMQDVHFKMCKKIAQLTKVIYALNTKNDEHEATVNAAKQLHEDMLNKVYAETKQKMEQYRNKVEELLEQVKSKSASEKTYAQQIQSLKDQMEQQQRQLSTEYAEKLTAKATELSSIKQQFTKQLADLENSKKQWQIGKETEMTQIDEHHRLELQRLASLNESLVQKHELEVTSLKKQIQESIESRSQLQSETDAKIAKMQMFYDKELEAIKTSYSSSSEERYRLLEQQLDTVNKEYRLHQQESKTRTQDLSDQLLSSGQLVKQLKEQIVSLEQNLKDRMTEYSQLHQTLAGEQQTSVDFQQKITQLEGELFSLQQVFDKQKTDLLSKSGLISELEASRLQHMATIDDLRKELQAVKQRATQLEQIKQTTESNLQQQFNDQAHKLLTLQQAYDKLIAENKLSKEKLTTEIGTMEKRYEELRNQLTSSHQLVLDDVAKQHELKLVNTLKTAETQLNQMRKDLETQLELERQKLLSEKDKLIETHKQVTDALNGELSEAKSEIQRLESLLQDGQRGLELATIKVSSLKEVSDHLQVELESARRELKAFKDQYTNLQNEHVKLQELHETSLKEAEQKLRHELKSLTQQLDEKWQKILTKDNQKLKEELREQKDVERQSLVQQLTSIKDAEMQAMKQGWESKVSELLQQISVLKQSASAAAIKEAETIDKLKREHAAEVQSLREEMLKAACEYSSKIDNMQSLNSDQLESLAKQHAKQLKEIEDRMRQDSMVELKTLTLAHRVTLDKLRDELERSNQEELDALRKQCESDMESLQNELELRFSENAEITSKAHQLQLQTCRMELDRAVELAKQKATEHSLLVTELEDKLKYQEKMVRDLKSERSELQNRVNDLMQLSEAKAKEAQHIRSEAARTLRQREAELDKQRQSDLAIVETDYMQKMQDMVSEFGRAQQILKDKIIQLQNMLEDAEERYQNRESRQEDLDLIARLRSTILEHEAVVKQLVEEKRYFQMELVNRETNFNRVFNADPKVGLLNPLAVTKKPKTKDIPPLSRFPSGSSSSSRLDPLPGSPHHDEKLNNLKPIPPPPATKLIK